MDDLGSREDLDDPCVAAEPTSSFSSGE